MFPWRRSPSLSGSTNFTRKSVYGTTSSFHNPQHFPVISDPILEFSTADFISHADFKSTQDIFSRPVPNIHQYKPSQHAINTRNSVMLPQPRPRASVGFQVQLQRSTAATPTLAVDTQNLDQRKSTTNSILTSANTTSPLAAPKYSRDPTHLAVNALTIATASAALNNSFSCANLANRRYSTARSLTRPDSTNPYLRKSFNPPSPLLPLEPSSSVFPHPSALSKYDLLSSADLKSRLHESEQRAIDILIEYQQKLDKARTKIVELEQRLQDESKEKRQLSVMAAQAQAQATAQANAAAAIAAAKSSIQNINTTTPTTNNSTTTIASKSITSSVKPDSTTNLDLTPASFLSSNGNAPIVSSNSIMYNNQNITPADDLSKMSNEDLQARVTLLETQRETLRNAMKSLRAAKDIESKQLQEQVSRLKKQSAYKEFINTRQTNMLLNNANSTTTTTTTTTTSLSSTNNTNNQSTPTRQSHANLSLPSLSEAPETITSSVSCGSLSISTLMPSDIIGESSALGISLGNNSSSSLKLEQRFGTKGQSNSGSYTFPTGEYPVSGAGGERSSPSARSVSGSSTSSSTRHKKKHQHSQSLFTTKMGFPKISSPVPKTPTNEFRSLNLSVNSKDDTGLGIKFSKINNTADYSLKAEEDTNTNTDTNSINTKSQTQDLYEFTERTLDPDTRHISHSPSLNNYTFDSPHKYDIDNTESFVSSLVSQFSDTFEAPSLSMPSLTSSRSCSSGLFKKSNDNSHDNSYMNSDTSSYKQKPRLELNFLTESSNSTTTANTNRHSKICSRSRSYYHPQDQNTNNELQIMPSFSDSLFSLERFSFTNLSSANLCASSESRPGSVSGSISGSASTSPSDYIASTSHSDVPSSDKQGIRSLSESEYSIRSKTSNTSVSSAANMSSTSNISTSTTATGTYSTPNTDNESEFILTGIDMFLDNNSNTSSSTGLDVVADNNENVSISPATFTLSSMRRHIPDTLFEEEHDETENASLGGPSSRSGQSGRVSRISQGTSSNRVNDDDYEGDEKENMNVRRSNSRKLARLASVRYNQTDFPVLLKKEKAKLVSLNVQQVQNSIC